MPKILVSGLKYAYTSCSLESYEGFDWDVKFLCI